MIARAHRFSSDFSNTKNATTKLNVNRATAQEPAEGLNFCPERLNKFNADPLCQALLATATSAVLKTFDNPRESEPNAAFLWVAYNLWWLPKVSWRVCRRDFLWGLRQSRNTLLISEIYPRGFQKLETMFPIHRVEVIYTEKIITLSNVSRQQLTEPLGHLQWKTEVVGLIFLHLWYFYNILI